MDARPVTHHAVVRVVHVHAAKVNHRTVQSTECRTYLKAIAPTVILTCHSIRMTIEAEQEAIDPTTRSDTLKMA